MVFVDCAGRNLVTQAGSGPYTFLRSCNMRRGYDTILAESTSTIGKIYERHCKPLMSVSPRSPHVMSCMVLRRFGKFGRGEFLDVSVLREGMK
jgi:hypothetical protein